MVSAVIGLLLMWQLIVRGTDITTALHSEEPLLITGIPESHSTLSRQVTQTVVVQLIVLKHTDLWQIALLVLPHFVLPPELVAVVSDTRVGERFIALFDFKVESEALVRGAVQRVGRGPSGNAEDLALRHGSVSERLFQVRCLCFLNCM